MSITELVVKLDDPLTSPRLKKLFIPHLQRKLIKKGYYIDPVTTTFNGCLVLFVRMLPNASL